MRTPTPVRDRGQLDALVLAALGAEDGDGDEVLHRVAQEVGAAPGVSRGRIYATLHRMARNRLVTRDPGERRYRLTDTGSKSLARRRAAADAFAGALHDLADPDRPASRADGSTRDTGGVGRDRRRSPAAR